MEKTLIDRHAGLTACVVAAICIVLGAALVVMPPKDWSENENRRLADLPEFSAETVAEGEFFSDVQDYLTDHFPLRDLFVSINTKMNTLLGRREINGVFVCDQGFLIDKYNEPVRTNAVIESLNRLYDGVGDRQVTLLAAPTAARIYSDKLPPFAQQADQSKTMEQLSENFKGISVDVTETLVDHRNDHQMYYRTDHHWTTYGAYYAYEKLCRYLQLEAIPMDKFTVECISEDFRGTTYSKVNDFSVPGEEMHRFILPEQELTVNYGSGEKTIETNSLYNDDYLNKKDKYSYFLNNINDLVIIDNQNAQTGRRLAVIKDSYANCLVPFLADHFEKIYVIDPRYYRNSVIDLINSDRAITDVLVLYNLGTMDTDTGVTVIY